MPQLNVASPAMHPAALRRHHGPQTVRQPYVERSGFALAIVVLAVRYLL
jgi:hypothetical protein